MNKEKTRERGKDERGRKERGREERGRGRAERGSELGGLLVAAELEGFTSCLDLDLGGLTPASN